MYLNFSFLSRYSAAIFRGIQYTVLISILSLFFGFALGIVVALMRRSKFAPFRIISTCWVEFLRNTPFLVQLFFLYYGLPELGINTEPVTTAIIALSISSSVPNCEVIRSGLMAVKKGYYETSHALGFSVFETFIYVVLPISLRLAFKPLTSNFINLVLTSSVVFSITVNEMMGQFKTIAASTSRPFEVFLTIMLAYCVLTFLLSFVSKIIDKKISITL
jgi:polar amino acid transport system permease protein/putative glutamine transport system permease protein